MTALDDVDNDVVSLLSLMLMTIALMTMLQRCRHCRPLPAPAVDGLPHAASVADSLVDVYGIHYATNQQYQWIMNMLVAQFLINMQTCTHTHTLTHKHILTHTHM